jgi:predicted Zn-dependent peptidase
VGPAVPSHEDGIIRTITPSGIRVVTERMPEARSVTVGVWVGVGSRDEPERLAGASHFLEHLLFKGTDRWSARALAQAVEARGGWFNAYTSREHTEYELRVPAAELDFAVGVLADVVAAPALRPDELEAERQVILEEIAMNEDDPDDTAHALLLDAVFPGHPMGRETLGTVETVRAVDRDDIAAFHDEHYRGANVVVAACGPIQHDQVLAALSGFLADRPTPPTLDREQITANPVPEVRQERPTEQAHVVLGWRALAQGHPDRFALAVANNVLGGGTSSRLFDEVREQRGLAYEVGSGVSLYSDTGLLSIALGTSARRAPEALAIIDEVVAGLIEDGPTEEELAVSVGYLCGSMLLSSEDTGSRMARLGAAEVAGLPLLDLDEVVARLRAVTLGDVHRVLADVLGGPRTLAIVGPA